MSARKFKILDRCFRLGVAIGNPASCSKLDVIWRCFDGTIHLGVGGDNQFVRRTEFAFLRKRASLSYFGHCRLEDRLRVLGDKSEG
jgi:hypothetical protein